MSIAAELEILISTRGAEMSKAELADLAKQCRTLAKSADTAGAATKGIGSDAEQAAKKIKGLDTAAKGAGKGAGQAVAPFKMMRGAATQLGYQVQDVAVQLQSGTHWMTVFGQQGSQVASLMGPGGALFGAVIAIGAAIGTVIFKMQGTADAIKRIKDKTEELKKSISDMPPLFRAERVLAVTKEYEALKDELNDVESQLDEWRNVEHSIFTPEDITALKTRKEIIAKVLQEVQLELFKLGDQGATPTWLEGMAEGLKEADDKVLAQRQRWSELIFALDEEDRQNKTDGLAKELAQRQQHYELIFALNEEEREQKADGLAKELAQQKQHSELLWKLDEEDRQNKAASLDAEAAANQLRWDTEVADWAVFLAEMKTAGEGFSAAVIARKLAEAQLFAALYEEDKQYYIAGIDAKHDALIALLDAEDDYFRNLEYSVDREATIFRNRTTAVQGFANSFMSLSSAMASADRQRVDDAKDGTEEEIAAADKKAEKTFNSAKNLNKGLVVMSTAAAIMQALKDPVDPFTRWANVAASAAAGAAQLVAINSTKYNGAGSVSVPSAPSSAQGGGNTQQVSINITGGSFGAGAGDDVINSLRDFFSRDGVLFDGASTQGQVIANG